MPGARRDDGGGTSTADGKLIEQSSIPSRWHGPLQTAGLKTIEDVARYGTENGWNFEAISGIGKEGSDDIKAAFDPPADQSGPPPAPPEPSEPVRDPSDPADDDSGALPTNVSNKWRRERRFYLGRDGIEREEEPPPFQDADHKRGIPYETPYKYFEVVAVTGPDHESYHGFYWALDETDAIATLVERQLNGESGRYRFRAYDRTEKERARQKKLQGLKNR